MQEQLAEALAPYQGQRGATIPALQKAQEVIGYLPEDVITEIAIFLGLTENEVYGVASFYAQFRFERQGEHTVKVCQGTACYVKGGRRILGTVVQELCIEPGGTTEDYRFSLERVACFGACALAPVVVVDNTVYAKMSTVKVKQLLAEYRGQ